MRCAKCGAEHDGAGCVLEADAGAQVKPPQVAVVAPAAPASVRRVGRPRLDRTPEERKRLRREYMKKRREGRSES